MIPPIQVSNLGRIRRDSNPGVFEQLLLLCGYHHRKLLKRGLLLCFQDRKWDTPTLIQGSRREELSNNGPGTSSSGCPFRHYAMLTAYNVLPPNFATPWVCEISTPLAMADPCDYFALACQLLPMPKICHVLLANQCAVEGDMTGVLAPLC